MTARHQVRACPFCGIVSDVPHETQEGCIAALQAEIARMRDILQYVKGPGLVSQPGEDRDRREPSPESPTVIEQYAQGG
jgi:hypothetical protein